MLMQSNYHSDAGEEMSSTTVLHSR